METSGGGWMGITPQMARDDLNGTLYVRDGGGNTTSGFDSSDRPHTQDGTGGHTAQYTFTLPYTIKQFFFKDYKAKSNAATSDSSDIYPSRFKQSDWDSAHEQSVGDISFGFANESGPITSFAKEQGSDHLYAGGDIANWPSGNKIYSISSGSDSFRISMREHRLIHNLSRQICQIHQWRCRYQRDHRNFRQPFRYIHSVHLHLQIIDRP